MATSALTALPLPTSEFIAREGLTPVAVEPPRNGCFSLYFAANAPYRVLHVSFEHFLFRRMSWCGSSVAPADLSAIAFSFLVRSGKVPCLARLEAENALRAAGIPFTFATLHS